MYPKAVTFHLGVVLHHLLRHHHRRSRGTAKSCHLPMKGKSSCGKEQTVDSSAGNFALVQPTG
jgi:hypothetical protein